MDPVQITRGTGPIILGMPHVGTWLPDDVCANLNERGRLLTDTDWHVDELYADLVPGVTTVAATFHRYVIDANRPPDGVSLYPGQNTTGLVPETDFDGHPLWDVVPDQTEIERRVQHFHVPYHDALASEIARIKAIHGVALLWDCHSIRSVIPFLFEGRLPDFNIGTVNGISCAENLAQIVHQRCLSTDGFTVVRDGRFKGGWTTRHYGRPLDGVHAIQMELAQSTHLTSEDLPFNFDRDKGRRLRPILSDILGRLADAVLQSRN